MLFLASPPKRDGDTGRHIYQALRTRILDGEIAPGARLKEEELAAQLGVSRTPVRAAVRQLARDALVRFEPNRGAVVRAWGVDDCREIFDLRAVLEGYCASQTALTIEADDLAELDRLIALQRATTREEPAGRARADKLAAHNAAFHNIIVRASNNERLIGIFEHFIEIPTTVRRMLWDSPPQCEAALVYHSEIVEAIRARDPLRVDAVMRSHIYAAKDFYIRKLSQEQEAR